MGLIIADEKRHTVIRRGGRLSTTSVPITQSVYFMGRERGFPIMEVFCIPICSGFSFLVMVHQVRLFMNARKAERGRR